MGEVIKKVGENEYDVRFKNETKTFHKDKLFEGHYVVEEILDHRKISNKTEVQILWNSGMKTWNGLSEKRAEIPDLLAEYACQKDILNKYGWKWSKKHVQISHLKNILGHRDNDGIIDIHIIYDDGNTKWVPVEYEQWDETFQYAVANDLTDTEEWEWTWEYEQKNQNEWFSKSQIELTNTQKGLIRNH